MRTRLLSSLVLLPFVAGCTNVPRVMVTNNVEGNVVYVWRFEGDRVVGVTQYVREAPTTEHPTRSVIWEDSAKVEKVPPPRR